MTTHDRDWLHQLLSAYLDNTVDAKERAFVEAMLRDVPATRALLDDLRVLGHGVRAARVPPVPATLEKRIKQRLDAEATMLPPAASDVFARRGGERYVLYSPFGDDDDLSSPDSPVYERHHELADHGFSDDSMIPAQVSFDHEREPVQDAQVSPAPPKRRSWLRPGPLAAVATLAAAMVIGVVLIEERGVSPVAPPVIEESVATSDAPEAGTVSPPRDRSESNEPIDAPTAPRRTAIEKAPALPEPAEAPSSSAERRRDDTEQSGVANATAPIPEVSIDAAPGRSAEPASTSPMAAPAREPQPVGGSEQAPRGTTGDDESAAPSDVEEREGTKGEKPHAAVTREGPDRGRLGTSLAPSPAPPASEETCRTMWTLEAPLVIPKTSALASREAISGLVTRLEGTAEAETSGRVRVILHAPRWADFLRTLAASGVPVSTAASAAPVRGTCIRATLAIEGT